MTPSTLGVATAWKSTTGRPLSQHRHRPRKPSFERRRSGLDSGSPPGRRGRPRARGHLPRGVLGLVAGRRPVVRWPAGQIAVKHRIVVDEKRWIGEARFLHALSYCNLLPGPEAQQLAIYIGWLMHGVRGGILAGGLFVVPGLVAIMVLSWIYAGWGHVGAVAALFFGLKAAVLAVVLQAVGRGGSRALKNRAMLGIAAVAFVCIFFLNIPFPIIIVAAGLLGWLGTRAGSPLFQIGGGHGRSAGNALAEKDSLLGEGMPAHAQVTAARAWKAASVWGVLWLAPVAALLLALGPDATFTRIALFFTEMAIVTFGGAY